MDDKLKTPYSHVFNFSFSRDLGHDFALEASYVGRLGRHLLQETDLALPEDIVDPASHMDYFTAATMFSKLAQGRNSRRRRQHPNPGYWEHLFPTAGGDPGSQLWGCDRIPYGQYRRHCDQHPGHVRHLRLQRRRRDRRPASTSIHPPISAPASPPVRNSRDSPGPTPYNFFMPQFSSLWGWRSSGNSAYHAFNLTLRHALRTGVQFDVNYTFSKSIDVGSNAERVNVFDNGRRILQPGDQFLGAEPACARSPIST